MPAATAHLSCSARLAAAVARALGGPRAAAVAALKLRRERLEEMQLGVVRPRGIPLRPLLPPPSHASVQAWVVQQQQLKAAAVRYKRAAGAAAGGRGGGRSGVAELRSDPNTGALLPPGNPLRVGAGFLSQPGAHTPAGSLLGTPELRGTAGGGASLPDADGG
jgi:hypothetical protein